MPPLAPKQQTHASVSRVAERLSSLLRKATEAKAFWVEGELSSVQDRGDKIYFDLVETRNDRTIAKLRCQIWGSAVDTVRGKLAEAGVSTFNDGLLVGLLAKVRFSEVYGLSLQVFDIDPATTLGVLEARRRQLVARLRAERLTERNALHPVPLLPQQVGLIASRETAGYADFVQTLRRSGYGIRLFHADARVQGEGTERSVLRALDCLAHLSLDVVVIIRGGGSKFDLAALDNEAIARKIATFGCAVWTGIGHETDESVLDLVAARAFKTPTAVAEQLVARHVAIEERLRTAATRISRIGRLRLARPRDRLKTLLSLLQRSVRLRIELNQQQLLVQHKSLLKTTMRALDREERRARFHRQRLSAGTAKQRISAARQVARQLRGALHVAVRYRLQGLRERLLADRRTIRAQRARVAVERSYLSAHEKSLLKTVARRLASASDRHARLIERFAAGRYFQQLDRFRERVSSYCQALVAPAGRLSAQRLKLAGHEEMLDKTATGQIGRARDLLRALLGRFTLQRYLQRIATHREHLDHRRARLRAGDPRNALERGYALVYDERGEILTSAKQSTLGMRLRTRLWDGTIESTVTGHSEENPDE